MQTPRPYSSSFTCAYLTVFLLCVLQSSRTRDTSSQQGGPSTQEKKTADTPAGFPTIGAVTSALRTTTLKVRDLRLALPVHV